MIGGFCRGLLRPRCNRVTTIQPTRISNAVSRYLVIISTSLPWCGGTYLRVVSRAIVVYSHLWCIPIGEAIHYVGIAETGSWTSYAVNMNIMSDQELLKIQLDELKREHRALDEEIASLQPAFGSEPLTLKRLKKRKLLLRDRISRIEDQLYPDIIA